MRRVAASVTRREKRVSGIGGGGRERMSEVIWHFRFVF